MGSSWGTRLLGSSIACLVLALIVPDEPLHLSGVMVVGGVVAAIAAFVVGSFQALNATDPEVRASAKGVVALSALTVLGTAAVLFARLMSQLS